MPSLLLAMLLGGAQPPDPGALERDLRALVATSGAEVAVALRTRDGAVEILIAPDVAFHAASTMKVPVMIELFRQAEAGLLSLDDPLPVRNEFHSIVDGSVYRLSEGDDSDTAVYAAAGGTLTLRQLCEAMITVSSNFATNLLIEKLGVENIRRTTASLGATGMKVLRGVEDQKAFDRGLSNTTTGRGLLVLFDALAHGRAVSPRADAAMVDILKRQEFKDGIPAGLPPGTPVAHKTGTITRVHHDAGLVLGPRPYVLVVLTRGFDEEKTSDALIARIASVADAALARH